MFCSACPPWRAKGPARENFRSSEFGTWRCFTSFRSDPILLFSFSAVRFLLQLLNVSPAQRLNAAPPDLTPPAAFRFSPGVPDDLNAWLFSGNVAKPLRP